MFWYPLLRENMVIAGATAVDCRQDSENVLSPRETETQFTVGAFVGANSDIFTFDSAGQEAVCTSRKIGTLIIKVAADRAECDFIAKL